MAAVLGWRLAKTGFALGIAAGGIWLWMGAFGTRFVAGGFEQLATWIGTGKLERPDLLIALPAAASTLALVIFAAVGYVRQSGRRWAADIGVLAAMIFAVLAYFIAIFAAFAPRYLGVFGIHVGS